MGLRGLLTIPLRVARTTWNAVMQRFVIDSRLRLALPVAGLDEATAHTILFALRTAAHSPEEMEIAMQWLAALEVAQVASDRLVGELRRVEEHLEYWTERLRQGQHLRTILFEQGPFSFAQDIYRIAARKRSAHDWSATDKIERRVIVLRVVRSQLAEAVAQVHAAASQLYLLPGKSATAADTPLEASQLFQVASRAIRECAHTTAKAMEEALRATQEEFARLALPNAELSRVAVSQVLRSYSKRMFRIGSEGRLSLTRDGQAGGQNGQVGNQHAKPQAHHRESEHDRTPVGPTASAAAALEEAQAVLQVRVNVDESTSARAAILEAEALAAQQPQLVQLPGWLQMPSRYQQHWIRYALFTAAAGYGAVFVYRHSRLSGSQDMERWATSAAQAIAGAWRTHVLAPLLTLRDELFQTFRARRSIVAPEDFEADKESLLRMLQEFEQDNATTSLAKRAAARRSAERIKPALEGMDFMIACYEDELKKPIRNLINGRLARTLLIQVQKLKVDLEAAMLEMDQILKANELSIALVAAIPAFLFAGLTIVGLVRWLTPTAPDPKWEALPCRMAMVEVERAVQQLTEGETAEEQGLLIYRLAMVYEEAIRLFRRHRLEASSEWANLRTDLVQLAAPKPVKQKMRIVKRMIRTYSIFQF